MSLLDDVSIVVTPNGYKAGELYAVIPVPTEGSEEVTNGSFSGSSTGWTESGNWAYGNNNEVCTGNGTNQMLTQAGILTSGKFYTYSVDIISSTLSSQEIRVYIGGSDYITHTLNGGVETITAITVSAGSNLVIRVTSANTSGVLTIDNVSVKEYTSADMDVTRATAATRVDENGLVNYAEVLGSEQVTAFTNGTVYPFTTFTTSGNNITSAIVSSAFAGAVSNSISVTSGEIYKVTFDYTKNSGDDLRIVFSSAVTGAGTQISNNELISVSGTYTKYFTITSTTTGYFQMGTGNSGHSLNASITNVSVKEVNRNNVPRIDYTGGGCPHILAEPQRTNVITYSEDFSQSAWTKSGATSVSLNDTISPDGTQNASTITGLTGSGSNDLIFYTSINPASKTYSFSVYLKGTGTLRLHLSNNVDQGLTEIVTLTSDWKRHLFTGAFNSTSGILAVVLDDASGATATQYNIWGAQLEEGSYATSYIPTSGSTVTRNKDLFTRDGIGSLINDSEGVLFLEVARLSSADNTSIIWSISDGSNSNAVSLYYGSSSRVLVDIFNSTGTKSLVHTMSSGEQANFNKLAIKYKSNDIALWVNGNEVATNTDSISLSGLNELISSYGSGSFPFYGKVKQLQVYKTALTDMQLIQLTGTSGTDFYESYSEMAESLTYTIQ